MRLRMRAPLPFSEVPGMQTQHPSIDRQPARGMKQRRALPTLPARARRAKGVLLATATVVLFAGCASLPASSGSGTSDTSSCTGPVSYCNIFFGS